MSDAETTPTPADREALRAALDLFANPQSVEEMAATLHQDGWSVESAHAIALAVNLAPALDAALTKAEASRDEARRDHATEREQKFAVEQERDALRIRAEKAEALASALHIETLGLTAERDASTAAHDALGKEAAGLREALRPVVRAFAARMEQKLRANDHKRGWQGDTPSALLRRLREETTELHNAIIGTRAERATLNPSECDLIAREAADVANFAMMIADVCGGLNGDAP